MQCCKNLILLLLFLVTLFLPNNLSRAGETGDPILRAEQLIEQGERSLKTGDYDAAEASLRDAIAAVGDLNGASIPDHRAVRSRCLRLLSHECYPRMGPARYEDAIATGHQYQAALENLMTTGASRQFRLCENAVHVARLYLALSVPQPGEAEEFLRTVAEPKSDPRMALDLWLLRAGIAWCLADTQPESDPCEWAATALERWSHVERLTVIILRKLEEDQDTLRTLAARYRPELAQAGELDQAIDELLELVRRYTREGGPQAVLLLARLEAHRGKLARAKQLAGGLLRRSQTGPDPDPGLQARTACQLASLETYRGELRAAEQHFRLAIRLCRENQPRAESNSDRITELLAQSYDGLGQVLCALGEYQSARSNGEKAVQQWSILLQKPDRKCVAQQGLVRALLHVLTVDKTQGRYPEAISLWEQIQKLMEQDSATNHSDLIELNTVLAACYLSDRVRRTDEQLSKAEQSARRAVELAEQHEDSVGSRNARDHLAAVLFERGRFSMDNDSDEVPDVYWREAENHWSTLLQEYQNVGERLSEGRALQSLGDLHFVQEEFDLAEQSYRQSIHRLQQVTALPITRFNAHAGLGRVLEKKGRDRLPEAADCAQEAIRAIELAGATCTGSREQQLQFLERFCEAYDLLVRGMLEQGKLDETLLFAETLRNRLLQEQLLSFGEKTDPLNSLSSSERRTFAELQAQLDRCYQRQRRIFDETEEERLRWQVADAEAELVRLWQKAWEATPTSRKLLPPREQQATLPESIRRILAAHERDLLLYYYLGDQASHLIVITPGRAERTRSYPLVITHKQGQILFKNPRRGQTPLTRLLGSALVEEFIKWCVPGAKRGPPPRRKLPRLRPFDEEQAIVLTEILLPLPEGLLRQLRREDYDHTIIVADPTLNRLPFAALPVRSTAPRNAAEEQRKYVLDLFPPICYAPSLQVLDQLESREANQQPGKYVLTMGGTSDDLPKASKECEELAQQFPEEVVKRLTGPRATKGLLQQYDGNCRVFHFADHATVQLESDNLMATMKVFWSGLGETRDGCDVLTLPEILCLDFRACEAAILSACSTNRGRETRLDSGQSLARAFLVAGASRVIATSWEIPDDDSVTRRLFRNLSVQARTGRPVDYAQALHDAMVNAKRNERSAPFYWAAYTLVGPPAGYHTWMMNADQSTAGISDVTGPWEHGFRTAVR